MNKKEIINKTKIWCEKEAKDVVKYTQSASLARTRCYGIVMFVTNLLGYDSPASAELEKWWDDEMHKEFRRLIIEGY